MSCKLDSTLASLILMKPPCSTRFYSSFSRVLLQRMKNCASGFSHEDKNHFVPTATELNPRHETGSMHNKETNIIYLRFNVFFTEYQLVQELFLEHHTNSFKIIITYTLVIKLIFFSNLLHIVLELISNSISSNLEKKKKYWK